jgi:hypothetical protein
MLNGIISMNVAPIRGKINMIINGSQQSMKSIIVITADGKRVIAADTVTIKPINMLM